MKFNLVIDKSLEESVTVTAHQKSALTDELEKLVARYSGDDKIIVYDSDEIRVISFFDVECVSVFDGRCEVIDNKGKRYSVRERLYEIEQRLPQCFIRINKSAIANERAIECFKTDFGAGVSVEFKCGYSDYVSRRCFAEIKRRFKKK